MKLPAFDYACPATMAEATALLASNEGAKVIAGGQSLVPMMAFRLSAPPLLVDLRKLPGLDEIRIDGDGVHLGAKVRWRDIQDDARLKEAHPLLSAAIMHVAHYQVRNRGTVGGSVAHADPAAEMPGVAAACDARIKVVGPAGERVIDARNFFFGALTTALADDEIVVEVSLPPWPKGRRWGFEEFSRRRGDFALSGVAVFFDEDASGRATNAHVGVIGTGDRPQRLPRTEAALNGRMVDENVIAAAGEMAASEVEPQDDIHASAAYRRALTATMLERALARACGLPAH